MRIAVTGANGLIGKHLIPELKRNGHEVLEFTRNKNLKGKYIYWNPDKGVIEESKLNSMDAIIHLAGENIANKKWTKKQKEYLLKNRIQGIQTLKKGLKHISNKPKTIIIASAIGYYGHVPHTHITEDDDAGEGFASHLCQSIEAEANSFEDTYRVVIPRIGVVLSKQGGALAKMIPPFKYYLGGKLGNGEQYMSWIDIEDLIQAFLFVLNNQGIQGAINLTSPHPVSNEHFSYALANALDKPCAFSIPAFVVELMWGEMGKELLLQGAQVLPQKLQDNGFMFKHKNIEESLSKHVI